MFEAQSLLTTVANGGQNTSSAGIGEPPIVPTLAAVANAIYNATGRARAAPADHSGRDAGRAGRCQEEGVMNRFEFAKATSVAEARSLKAEKPGSVLKAGGIDLLDHMKEHLVEPPRLVDLKGLPGMKEIKAEADGSLTIGPLVTMAEVAANAGVQKTHRALAEACGEAASPQIRNVATIGGNVLQRPRCWYYRLESYKCLKKGGNVCYAIGGENRYHVIFGGGPSYAPHPSNAAVPLVAFGATFTFEGAKGKRTVPRRSSSRCRRSTAA
jgi:CO/xanthine dehydrogenase FAD-binding subunit